MENNKKHPTDTLMSDTMEKVRQFVDANTVVGTPIQAEGVTIIPVSRVSMGFASGGADFTTKNQKPDTDNCFGGGGGAGVNVTPVAFLIVHGDNVRLMPLYPPAYTTVDRVVELVPDLVDKVSALLKEKKEEEQQ